MTKRSILIFAALLSFTAPAYGSESKVLVTVNPLHGLIASVLDGIEDPKLLIPGADSVHGYQQKPSDARSIESAKVFVWIGPTFESSFIAAVENMPATKTVIEAGDLPGLVLFENRESPGAHGDDDHGETEHARVDDEHEHREDEHHGEDEHHEDHDGENGGHDDEHGHEHEHGRWDMHVWMSIDNAKLIVRAAADEFKEIFPEHEARLSENLDSVLARLDELKSELTMLTEPVADVPYIVFHDAYQYLEEMLSLNNVGAVTISPERQPGARKIIELQETVSATNAKCIFREPQFSPEILEVVAEGTDLKFSSLDPLGADVPPGPDSYFEIMRAMASSLRDCLL